VETKEDTESVSNFSESSDSLSLVELLQSTTSEEKTIEVTLGKPSYTITSKTITESSNKTSILLFVDNTSVIEMSEAKAEKKYLNLMFASTSHEL